MATFVIETYLAAGTEHKLGRETRRLRLATKPTGGGAVRYIRSYYVPLDELAFHVVAAPSIEAVMETLAAAAIVAERVVEAETADA